jgi:hypothetical protein
LDLFRWLTRFYLFIALTALRRGLRGVHSEPWDANLPEDVERREAIHASNDKVRARDERKQVRSTAHRAAKVRGLDAPTESGSSSEGGGGKEARETTPPLLSSPRITRPPFSDIFSQQVGATVSERQ